MSPGCPAGEHAGRQATPVHWRSTQISVALIRLFQYLSTTEKRDRFEYSKQSLSIAHVMANGDTCPQGTLGAVIVATCHNVGEREGPRQMKRSFLFCCRKTLKSFD